MKQNRHILSQTLNVIQLLGGGYKPLVFAVISALSAVGVQAADINVDWESAKTDANVVVNKDGNSNIFMACAKQNI